jgi:TolB-like protein
MTNAPSPITRLLAELRRRKVFRATALYGAAAFGLLQAADIVLPAIGVPENAVTLLVVVVLAGFPVAVFVAWTFDLTSGGLRRTGAADSGELDAILAQPRRQRWPAGILGLLGIGLLTFGAWWTGARSGAARSEAPAEEGLESVAVLPFVNFGDPEDEPFVDGLAEELGNTLAQIEGLRVAARSSAFVFKGRDVDARAIGRELGVGSIVEGSVRRAGGTVRISAQLSRTSDGFRLWSETWERELTAANVFAIQDEITADIALALTRELRPEARAVLEGRRTANLEAYDLYLLGRHRWATRRVDAVREAIGHYEEAIALDSSYALAWAGLADAWSVLPFYDGRLPGRVAYPQAARAADRALALAPELAEANAARGIIATEYEQDLARGERLLETAVERNPSYAQAWAWLCETRATSGRDAEALPACERAVELDPLGVVPNLLLTIPLAGLGRTEEALAQQKRALAIFPDVTFSQFMHAGLLLPAGRIGEAEASLEELGRIEGAPDPAALGRVARAWPGTVPSLPAIEAVRALEAETGPGLYFLAGLYDWAGSEEDAVRVVRDAVAAQNPWIGMAAVFPMYDGLRENPEFGRILAGQGLPNGNTAYREGRGEK